MRRRALVAAVAVFASAGTAMAAKPTLRWEAPPSCPSERAVNAEIARMLEGTDGARNAVTASAVVRGPPVGGTAWTVDLALRTEATSARRQFAGSSCKEVAAASALIVALAVDERARSVEPTFEEPAPPRSFATASAPEPPRTELAAGRSRERDRWRLAALAGVAFDGATLPRATFGPEVGLAARRGPIRLEAFGSLYAKRNIAEGRFSFLTTGARACGVGAFGRLEIGPCARGRVAIVGATGTGATSSFARTAAWPSLGASALVALRLGRLGLRLELGAELPLRRPTFVIREPVMPDLYVHRPATVTVVGACGLDVVFF